MLSGHGDDIRQYDNIRINFSSNIYNGFDHTELFKYLSGRMASVCNYPESTPLSVEAKLAKMLHVLPENVMVTNGATESIYLIAQTYRGANSFIQQPTFSEYADACRIHGHNANGKQKLYWLCNPNNPTGTVTPKQEIISMVTDNPSMIFILDASYAAYTTEPVLSVKEGITYPNLLMLHSMTKDYGIPGLRLGYITAHSSLLEKIAEQRMPWSVGQLAIEAAHYLITHHDNYIIDAKAINQERERMTAVLQQIGIEVYPSQSNILLCHNPVMTAAELKHNLATNHGILIRDASNFLGLDDHHFRIAVQTPPQNDQLLYIFNTILPS